MKDIPIIDQIGLEEEGVITAKKCLGDIEKLPSHIDTALILFDNKPNKELLDESVKLFTFVAASSLLDQYVYKNKLVIAYSPLGGPAAGGLIEELIAYGINKFIAVGISGYLVEEHSEDFLVVTKAIRDEGLSYHYLKPSLYVETDVRLNNEVKKGLENHNLKYHEGITWTTDAFFRETKSKINKRKTQGAVSVEMESASMAAVCKYYNKQFSQILFSSDVVKQSTWSGFRTDRLALTHTIQKVIIDIILET